MQNSFNRQLEDSIRQNREKSALTDFKGSTYLYKDVARKIEKIHILFDSVNIQKGDKIAICGRNSAHWAISFLVVASYGAVFVPILHDFTPDNIHHIVNHCESK